MSTWTYDYDDEDPHDTDDIVMITFRENLILKNFKHSNISLVR